MPSALRSAAGENSQPVLDILSEPREPPPSRTLSRSLDRRVPRPSRGEETRLLHTLGGLLGDRVRLACMKHSPR